MLASNIIVSAQPCVPPFTRAALVLRDSIGNNETVFFGYDSSAVYGLDPDLCEVELPPQPPTGVFDVRFMNIPGREGQDTPNGMGQGFDDDFRAYVSSAKIDTFRVRYAPDFLSEYTLVFSWNPLLIGALWDSVVVKDQFGGIHARMHVDSTMHPPHFPDRLIIIAYGQRNSPFPPTPILVSPDDAALNQPLLPLLIWSEAGTKLGYRLQVSTDSSFGTIVLDDSTLTGLDRYVGPLEYSTRYFWRVSAKNDSGYGSFSAYRHFTTLPHPPVYFLTVSPESVTVHNPTGNGFIRPARRGRDPGPNWSNLVQEVVVQGGFQPGATESDTAGGMIIGISHVRNSGGRWLTDIDSASKYGWARLSGWSANRNRGRSYASIQKSLEDADGAHAGRPRGLDFLAHSGWIHLLKGEKHNIPPRRHSNSLYAELVVLKLNIASSQLGKTPIGFGEILFQQPGHICHGLALGDIAAKTDTAMTHWQGRAYSEFDSLFSAIYRINRAFVSPLDTISWTSPAKLVLRGAISVTDIPFLQLSSVRPTILIPTTSETEDLEDFDEIGFSDQSGFPFAAKLYQNYPNPFNPSTTIAFRLKNVSMVTIKVYDLIGREVATVVNGEEFDEGYNTLDFYANNLSSGIYFYQIDAQNLEEEDMKTVETRKMLLLK